MAADGDARGQRSLWPRAEKRREREREGRKKEEEGRREVLRADPRCSFGRTSPRVFPTRTQYSTGQDIRRTAMSRFQEARALPWYHEGQRVIVLYVTTGERGRRERDSDGRQEGNIFISPLSFSSLSSSLSSHRTVATLSLSVCVYTLRPPLLPYALLRAMRPLCHTFSCCKGWTHGAAFFVSSFPSLVLSLGIRCVGRCRSARRSPTLSSPLGTHGGPCRASSKIKGAAEEEGAGGVAPAIAIAMQCGAEVTLSTLCVCVCVCVLLSLSLIRPCVLCARVCDTRALSATSTWRPLSPSRGARSGV